MKTLAVLSALAAVAIAAPTLPQEQEPLKTIANVPDTWKQQRRSPQEFDFDRFDPALESPGNLPSTPQLSEFGLSGRSIALKKPIIVKRKQGHHHLYRDSDEEPAESGEICGNQVKVKLCDPKTSPMRSTTVEDVKHLTEDEMQHNIQLAKEAIENLQRDLKNDDTSKTWAHGQSASDAKLHQEIEVAREALEHIHQNIGKLESMKVPATRSEAIQTKETMIADTEEQRLAQWKEAMESIRKNAEIVKNIEDSFKDTSDVTGLVSDTQDLSALSLKAAEEIKTQNDPDCKDSCSEHKKTKDIQDDMAPSASTNSEVIIKSHQDTKKDTRASETQVPVQTEILNAAMDTILFEDSSEKPKFLTSESMKIFDEHNHSTTEDKKLISNQNTDNELTVSKVKSRASDSMMETNSEAKKHMQAENMDTDLKNEKSHPDIKAAENSEKDDIKKDDHMMNKEKMEMKPAKTMNDQHSHHTSHEERKALPESSKHPTEEMDASSNSEKMPSRHHLQSFLHPEMRSADEMNSMTNQHLTNVEHFTAHKMQPMHMSNDMLSQHAKIMPSHHVHQGASSHHSSMGLQHARRPDMMMQAKSADNMDMQMHYMSARDGLDMDSQRFRWKTQHDAMPMDMRSSYGPPTGPAPIATSSGGSEAVGVFPSANLPSSYAIPLLLSCSPSVVRGNLAKHHTPYSSPPAYRSEDDFNFHNMRRDVRKIHENLSTLPQKTLQQSNHKSTVLVAKQ